MQQSKGNLLEEHSKSIASRLTPEARSFVISLRETKAIAFGQGNDQSSLGSVAWMPAVNGWTLDAFHVWGDLIQGEPVNLTTYNQSNLAQKNIAMIHLMPLDVTKSLEFIENVTFLATQEQIARILCLIMPVLKTMHRVLRML
jgi:hypothetical protein